MQPSHHLTFLKIIGGAMQMQRTAHRKQKINLFFSHFQQIGKHKIMILEVDPHNKARAQIISHICTARNFFFSQKQKIIISLKS